MLFIAFGAIFLVALTLSVECLAAEGEGNDIYRTKIGDVEIFMLSEVQRDGDPSILIGASSADLKKFIPSGKYPSAVNAFALRSPEGITLIDTGYGRKLFDNLERIGIASDDVGAILITHSHGDHIGGLVRDGSPAFQKAKVYIAKLEYEWSQSVRQALLGYEGRVELIAPGELSDSGPELLKGVRAISAYGHTPGHTVFMIESGGERLLIWGDVTHAMAIQAPRPGVSVTYDSDPKQAAAVRKSIIEYVFERKIPVAGMHIAYPGIGRLERDPEAKGSYKFAPLP
ncbi:MAG: MBL fold metallo-hydrolase [Synergistaceae bacterium]|nr:MBL fold metallo-hydrolase [Synergistaceae bacterium]